MGALQRLVKRPSKPCTTMPHNPHGPTGADEVTGYRMSPAEHRLRIDFSVGGRETGLQRALNTLDDEGRRDLYTGTKDTYERAVELLNHSLEPVTWDVYTILESEDQLSSLGLTPDFEPLEEEHLNSRADLRHFGLVPPTNSVVLHSPGTISSDGKDNYYAWVPTEEDVSICLCPAKLWQQDSSLLCKHEIASLIAVHEDRFQVSDLNIDHAKKTLVSKNAYMRFDPSDP